MAGLSAGPLWVVVAFSVAATDLREWTFPPKVSKNDYR